MAMTGKNRIMIYGPKEGHRGVLGRKSFSQS
jgi:hypothetical protein